MHDLLMAVKVSMIVVQKVQENIQENLWKKPGSFVCQSMCSLLKCFTNCLMDGKYQQYSNSIDKFLLSKYCCLSTKIKSCLHFGLPFL